MASIDLKSELDVVVALNTQAISTDTTTAGVKLDLAGAESCTFVIQAGAVTAGDVTPLIEDSADNTTFAAVSDTFLIGTEAAALLDAANEIATVGYVGKKRYVRLSAVSDNSADLTVGAVAIKGSLHNMPPA